jgi:hypothetical protein
MPPFLTGEGLLDLFEEDRPEAIFSSFTQGFGQPQRRFFEKQFSNFFNEFQGDLARQAQVNPQAAAPNQTFQQFLSGTPFTDRFASLAPSLRGFQNRQFAPQTRFFG